MNNVFKDFTIGEFFDLKGSTQGRNLLQDNEGLDIREAKYGKTAMKDLDFLKFRRDQIVLDEANPKTYEIYGKTETLRDVIDRDCNLFATCGIIDYSLLLGKLVTVDRAGHHSLEGLENQLIDDPSLAHGVFLSQPVGNEPASAYVIAIIDPLTGFTFKKNLEFRFKQCKHGMRMSCVPPR